MTVGPRSQMPVHQVEATGTHAMISARKISHLSRKLKEQARMTLVNIDFSIDASTAFTVPEFGINIIKSPPVMTVMTPFHLILEFQWIVSAPDSRAEGVPPFGIYLNVVNQDAKPAVCRGKLVICDRDRDRPHKIFTCGRHSSNKGIGHGIEPRFLFALNRADGHRITQENGTIRFLGKIYVDVPSVSKWLEF